MDLAELFLRLGPFAGDDTLLRRLVPLFAHDEDLCARLDAQLRAQPRCQGALTPPALSAIWWAMIANAGAEPDDQRRDPEITDDGRSAAALSRAENAAQELLRAVPGFVWDGTRLPVPVADIADSVLCLRVREVEEMAAAPGLPPELARAPLSGLLLPELGEIWVNAAEAREWPARKRFTIGHELGHWQLHRETFAPIFCRTETVDASIEAASAQREREANAFAAALVMPAELVIHHYERLRTAEPEDRFAELCKLFEVSAKALERRLTVLGLSAEQ
ncbi:ImmA/IrrE family metallo-endopeptidase [Thermoleophilum album]|uniref:IrrE N-terminal-like domain-containing protein n=1 Tax=Thermoleophilum album TaxID=29539 RepID=A0A1H6FHQ2_THEAL|nr:ImmA/IrrE family metallo-endopeptidase [Thermoleophilum album]SEH10356.1 protein of unknown function [Thermoleophilum album]